MGLVLSAGGARRVFLAGEAAVGSIVVVVVFPFAAGVRRTGSQHRRWDLSTFPFSRAAGGRDVASRTASTGSGCAYIAATRAVG